MNKPIFTIRLLPHELMTSGTVVIPNIKKRIREVVLSKIPIDPNKGYLVRSRAGANWECRVFERKKFNINKAVRSLTNPIRRNLDYVGVFRKAIKIQKITNEEELIYDKEIDINKILSSQKNQNFE